MVCLDEGSLGIAAVGNLGEKPLAVMVVVVVDDCR